MIELRLFEGTWINGVKVKGVKVNPRYTEAQFEYRWMCHPEPGAKDNFVAQAWPTRFETREDVINKKPVPCFLVELEDGTTVECF